MAIFHHTTKIISRSAGQSVVAAAAYRSCEKLIDERQQLTHDYERKQGLAHQIVLTPDDAPEWMKDRQKLWNAVEKAERRGDAQLAREVEFALPKELNREQQITFAESYCKDNFTANGMIADLVIHDKGDGNPHAHVLLTFRKIDITKETGFGNKEREWNNHALATERRKNFAEKMNKELERLGLPDRVDHRSFKEQGVDRIPTQHLGKAVTAMEGRGEHTIKGDTNREIKAINEQIQSIEKEIGGIENAREINLNQRDNGELERRYAQEVRANGLHHMSAQRNLHDGGQRSMHLQESMHDKLEQYQAEPSREEMHRSDPSRRITVEMSAGDALKQITKDIKKADTMNADAYRKVCRDAQAEKLKIIYPYLEKAATEYFVEAYRPRIEEVAREKQRLEKVAIQLSDSKPKFYEFWKVDSYNEKVDAYHKEHERNEKAKENLNRIVGDKISEAVNITKSLSGSQYQERLKVLKIAEGIAVKSNPALEKPLKEQNQKIAVASKEFNAGENSINAMRKTKSLLEKCSPKAEIKLPAISGGGGSATPNLDALRPNQPDKGAGIVALSAAAAADPDIDWHMLSPGELESAMYKKQLEREGYSEFQIGR